MNNVANDERLIKDAVREIIKGEIAFIFPKHLEAVVRGVLEHDESDKRLVTTIQYDEKTRDSWQYSLRLEGE